MAQAASAAAKPRTASTSDRMRDSLGGAVATLRDLFSDGAFEVITPPTRDSDAQIDAKTLVQIDGDVVTLIRETAPAAALDNHFVRVRSRLDALDRPRAGPRSIRCQTLTGGRPFPSRIPMRSSSKPANSRPSWANAQPLR